MSQQAFDGESLITPETITKESVAEAADLAPDLFSAAREQIVLILDAAKRQFDQDSEPKQIIHEILKDLHDLRQDLHQAVWQSLIPIAQNHPVSEFFLQDPFTRWSFEKPRGYSGDAHLLDFVYGHSNVMEQVAGTSPLGRALYGYTKEASSSVAARERRDLLTRHVDEIAAVRGQETEVLAIAAGHLREANRSIALQEGRIKRWIALDQDPLSVASIRRDFQGTRVEAIDGSVRGLLTNAYDLGRFDFIYAAGLYDYLSRKVAVKLTRTCMQMLKPNGTFLFANFAQDSGDDGYMETFMNWALLLRSEADMWDIIDASADRNTVDASVHFGTNRNIVYGILKQRA